MFTKWAMMSNLKANPGLEMRWLKMQLALDSIPNTTQKLPMVTHSCSLTSQDVEVVGISGVQGHLQLT